MNLSKLKPGHCGRVLCVHHRDGRRLTELGLIRGARVECLFRAPLGDPTAYLIGGATVALRKEDACCVRVEPIWD